MDIVEKLRTSDPYGDSSDLLNEAANEIERLRKLDQEAAQVELVICMHSRYFTGEEPYVGWSGLALALSQDYSDLEKYLTYNTGNANL